MSTRRQVGMPWRPQPDRMGAFARCCAWWNSHGFDVVYADAGPRRAWNAAASRNRLIQRHLDPAEVYILADADTLPEIEPLEAAIAAAATSPLLQLPYHLYRRAIHDTDSTGAATGRVHTYQDEYVDGACSGVLVFNRSVWETVNGQDERFEGWGLEDTAFRLAHETLLGPIQRQTGVVHTIEHSRPGKRSMPRNQTRFSRYLDAYGRPEAMLALVNEGPPVRAARHADTEAVLPSLLPS